MNLHLHYHLFACCFPPQPPQKAQAWDGVFVADTLSNVCMQFPLGVLTLTHPTWNKYDEDCLNLNIYVPEVMNN